jgi:hypothetical protein
MSKKPLSADLVAAYRATEYRVAEVPFTLHVNQRSPALAKLYRDTGNTRASFMTADNPFSVPASAAARPGVAWPAATSSTSLPVTRASLRSAAACARLPSSAAVTFSIAGRPGLTTIRLFVDRFPSRRGQGRASYL